MSYTEEIEKLGGELSSIYERLNSIGTTLNNLHIGEMLMKQGRIEYSIQKIEEILKFDSYPAGLDSLKFVKPKIGENIYFIEENKIKKEELIEVTINKSGVSCTVYISKERKYRKFSPEEIFDTEAEAVKALNAHLKSLMIEEEK